MYANEDIYSGPTDPTTNINPKIIGAFYINTKTAKLFVCTDNTNNNNVWKICNPDIEIPEIPEIPEMPFSSKYRAFYNRLKPYVIYTSDPKFPMFLSYNGTTTGSNERHGSYIKDVTNNVILSEFYGGNYGDIVCAIIKPGIQFMFGRTDNQMGGGVSTLELSSVFNMGLFGK